MTRDQHTDDNDRTTELLTQALAEESAMVQPGPGGLQQIQARTAESDAASKRTRRRWMLVTPLGAGLAAAAVIFGIVLANGGSNNGTGGTPSVSQPGPHQGVYNPNAPASEQFTMWYVGPDPANPQLKPRLFSETHTVTDPGDDPQMAAVRELLTSTPIDPDYRNPWPQGLDVADISDRGGLPTLNLISDGGLSGPSGHMLDLARQMLARTAGLSAGDGFGLSFNGTGIDRPYGVSQDDDVRAFISIDNIVDGQTVSSPLTVEVSGNVFEGNVNWTLLDSDGVKVDEGYTTTSQGTWTQVPVDLGALDPGAYTFTVTEYSAEDGTTVQNQDDKTFTVQ